MYLPMWFAVVRACTSDPGPGDYCVIAEYDSEAQCLELAPELIREINMTGNSFVDLVCTNYMKGAFVNHIDRYAKQAEQLIAKRTEAAQKKEPASEERAARPREADRSRNVDTLALDATNVTGHRELPKVLHIVPWKKSELGDVPAQPFNTLIDEALTPLDRDVHRRELTYFRAIQESTQHKTEKTRNVRTN